MLYRFAQGFRSVNVMLAAIRMDSAEISHDLYRVIEAWTDLSDAIRAAIMAMIESTLESDS